MIRKSIYASFGKRVFDLALALPTLLVISPLLTGIALLVWVSLQKPFLFRQTRPGLAGRHFTIYKFRTMTNAEDTDGNLLPDEKRLTRLGKFLRVTSLDELPELFNVLKGDMSLVGPRPLLAEYLQLYNEFEHRRHEVRPGITGWAQVMGRNAITWDEKFKLDVWYVENLSLRLDIKIILLSILKTLRQEGISQPGQATMEKFKGHSCG